MLANVHTVVQFLSCVPSATYYISFIFFPTRLAFLFRSKEQALYDFARRREFFRTYKVPFLLIQTRLKPAPGLKRHTETFMTFF